MWRILVPAAFLLSGAWAQDSTPVFGTTVVIPSGLRGQIYNIGHRTKRLPDFAKMKPVGVIYTSMLNVPLQDFKRGFPGVTKRYEWFAIDYAGRFWIEQPGDYTFSLLADDGARLYIDDQLVVDNDGIHMAQTKEARVTLAGGIHRIGVGYFQGPRYQVALVLMVTPPSGIPRVFSTDEFKPPPNPDDWKYTPR